MAAAGVGFISAIRTGCAFRHRALFDVAHRDEHNAGRALDSEDYWNVAKVLRLSPWKTFTNVMVPATLPYIFTGYRLSLGIAWLVIVASEMLTGTPGIGGFLWQEYNSLVYAHILLCIITIGLIGFFLDRVMGLVESRLRTV